MTDYGLTSSQILKAFNSIVSSLNTNTTEFTNLTPNIVANMIGLSTTKPLLGNITNYGSSRSEVFWNFWNSKNESYYANLGSDFITFSSISTTGFDTDNSEDFKNTNIIYVLILNLMLNITELSSYDSYNFYPSPNLINSNNNLKGLSNLRSFIRNSGGLGNIPLNNGVAQGTSINKGFVYQYCGDVYNQFCNDKKLSTTSSKCISSYRKYLSNNKLLSNWCGCFSPVPTYITDNLKNVTDQEISVCDSLCRQIDSIKIYLPPGQEGNDARIEECNANVCFIDNNNISVNNSSAKVNFNQICPCTPGQECLCFIETDIPGLLDNVSSGNNGLNDNINLNQKCTGGALCYKIDGETGNYSETPCNPINTPKTGSVFTKNTEGMSLIKDYSDIGVGFWLVFLTISIILTISIFCFIFIKIFQ